MDPSSLELERAKAEDRDALHELFCLPDVYRYLADGVPPQLAVTQRWIEKGREDSTLVPQLGLFNLVDSDRRICGCVRTHLLDEPTIAELTYVLHPKLWGRGIATAMAWTAIRLAFESQRVGAIVAGTDDPNEASLAVMNRLGMKFLRRTQNPKWSGVEYVRYRSDPPPDLVPQIIPLASSRGRPD
jgi:[ribosomal protein S5]-alanine N-acetyltransferase